MFDTFDAQRINPQPYGTYRDSEKAAAERRQKWGQPNISPLSRTRKLSKVRQPSNDGAFRR